MFPRLLRRCYQTGPEFGKRNAAYKAVDSVLQHLYKGSIGIGSGSTIIYALERMSQLPELRSCVFVPSSFQSRQLILRRGLTLGSLEQFPRLDVSIDGADEIDLQVNAIKGGGACLFQEKLIAHASSHYVLVADERKQSDQLGTRWTRGIPIEVAPLALASVKLTLEEMWPQASVKLRIASSADKAGPVVTDNGNLLLDCHVGPINDPASVYRDIKLVSGVIDAGLFCGLANAAYFGRNDAKTVDIWQRP